jgi:flagellar protein FlgJ
VVAQAALESGWGRHEIRAADGSTTHNVFGVKAGRNWHGPVVEKTTTEFVNGVAQKTTAKFRAYGSYAEAFRDYASVLRNNPRYAGIVGQTHDAKGFANGLQQAGYATDPAYADKLVRVINGSTLRMSLQAEPPAQVLARR